MLLQTEQSYQQLQPFLDAPCWWVAYSGGLDSTVLLHWLNSCPGRPLLRAVHIDHQIHSDSAQWAAHCQHQAGLLNVECIVERVELQGESNLEEQARNARYAVFESLISDHETLMMGHHQDDQAETVLLRLLRGSGSSGLSAIPQRRSLASGQLYRPLLALSRQQLEIYAQSQQLTWVDDPSNAEEGFDRNFLRNRVFPLLSERWPGYREPLSWVATLSAESLQLNRQLAELDFQRVNVSPEHRCISLRVFEGLDAIRQKNILLYWFEMLGVPMPSKGQLQSILKSVIAAGDDAKPNVSWSGIQLRRFQQSLYVVSQLSPVPAGTHFQWKPSDRLMMAGAGELSASKSLGRGINLELLKSVDSTGFTIRFRQGGERCKPSGRGSSQTLKKLFQEYAIEPWLRDLVPLIYHQDQLIAVGDVWVNAGWEVGPDNTGCCIEWQRPE